MLAQDTNLNQKQALSLLLTKTECLFTALWHNGEGTIKSEDIAKYYEVPTQSILDTLQTHFDEFADELIEDNWTPRLALRMGMLLKSDQATRVRSLALDVIEAHKCRTKKQQIAFLLEKTDFKAWSNREIAKVLECSHTLVNEVRRERSGNKVVEFKRKHRQPPSQTKDSIDNSGDKWKVGFHSETSNPDSVVRQPTATVRKSGDVRDGEECVIVDEREDHWQKLVRFPDGEERAYADTELDSPSAPYVPVDRTYTEDELQEAIARAIEEAQIGKLSEFREKAEASVQEELKAARAIASQRSLEVAKLQQKVDELKSLRGLEVENKTLKQEIENLKSAIRDAAINRWDNTFTQEAQKVLNANTIKVVENLEPDLHLRQMAHTAPERDPRGTINLLGLALEAMADGHPRFATELRKAAAIILGVDETSLSAKRQQLEQLREAIASFRQVVNSNPTWDEILNTANQYPLIKQEVWLELTPQERIVVDKLRPWKNPQEWDGGKYQPLGQFHLIHNGTSWLIVPPNDIESFTTPHDWLNAWEQGETKEGAIAHSDNTMVAYSQHAEIVEVKTDNPAIRVKWRERIGKTSEYEWFFSDELQQLRVVQL